MPHPITRLTSPIAALDLLYGGNELEAIEESLVIARDLRDVLLDGENILYVNTLVNNELLSSAMGKRFDHGARRGRNHFITYCFGETIEKLPFIRYMVRQYKVKYLIITGFELAALDSRQRGKFLEWLRMMRNYGVNVIIFTVTRPRRYGALGSLGYSARSIAEVGEYLKQPIVKEKQEDEEAMSEVAVVEEAVSEEAAVEEAAVEEAAIEEAAVEEAVSEELAIEETATEEAVLEEAVVEEEVSQDKEVFSDEPDATKLYAETPSPTHPKSPSPQVPQSQHSDSVSLKTKDLACEFV